VLGYGATYQIRFRLRVCTSPVNSEIAIIYQTVQRIASSIRKTSRFAYGPLINPLLSLSKISYKYNCMLTYISVSFLVSFKKGLG